MERRKNVPDILRKMDVGEEEKFPLEQARNVMTVYSSNMITERLEGKRWMGKRDNEKLTFTVTRIS